MGNHKFLKAVTAVAAIGGVCYLFKDKIKESSIYQSMDVDDKVQKVKTTIKEKMPSKNEESNDYFTLDDDEVTEAPADTEEDVTGEDITEETDAAEVAVEETPAEEAATENTSDLTAMVDDLLSDIPTINLDSKNAAEKEADSESPLLYENDGLSDTDEDIDVLEEQDKLDF